MSRVDPIPSYEKVFAYVEQHGYKTPFDQFLDMVCYGKGEPKDGDVITIGN